MTANVANIPGFQVIRPVGTGRTSHVFLAKDKLGRDVALKVPKPEIFQDPALVKMFANEVMLSRSLEHPNIVPTFDGHPNGPTTHLSMKYFPNGTIEEVDFMSLTAMRILRDIAAALEYIHGRRIAHQDIKPGNIYLHEGRAYLADFGGAANETQDGQVAGSPFYMAPELYIGERGSARSDIYSLGIVAYEVLTGVRPIVGESIEQLQAGHLAKVPAPARSLKPSLPREVANIVDRAIAKNPLQRPNAGEFRRAFETALEGSGDDSRKAQPTPTNQVNTPTLPDPPAPETPAPTPIIGRAKTDTPTVTPVRRIEATSMRAKDEPKSLLSRLLKRK
jgi:serine/threonine-protein kinase